MIGSPRALVERYSKLGSCSVVEPVHSVVIRVFLPKPTRSADRVYKKKSLNLEQRGQHSVNQIIHVLKIKKHIRGMFVKVIRVN